MKHVDGEETAAPGQQKILQSRSIPSCILVPHQSHYCCILQVFFGFSCLLMFVVFILIFRCNVFLLKTNHGKLLGKKQTDLPLIDPVSTQYRVYLL